MSGSTNFFASLRRNREDVSKAIAKDLALMAYESHQDQVRALDKQIREVKAKLNQMRDSAYTDPLLVALKKNQTIDVENELVQKRCNLLLELKELYDAKKIIGNDKFFAIPVSDFAEDDDEFENLVYGRDNDGDEAAAAASESD